MTGTDRPVSELGEAGLIERILAQIGDLGGGVVGGGDDAAIAPVAGASVLMTTDALVDGVDFDLSYGAPGDVGWKALAVNASDIAAMCGRPLWATITMGLPPETRVATVDGIVAGALDASAEWKIGLVGGDISRAPHLWVSVAMVGAPLTARPMLRRGARIGDALCVTGCLGGAALGLRLLRGEGASPPHRSQPTQGNVVRTALVARQLRPKARVEQAAVLASFGPSSMIDVSDGLATDLARLLAAGQVGCRIDPEAIPVDPGVAAETDRAAALELALAGGEDFELLFTIDEESLAPALAAVEATGVACSRMGTIAEGPPMVGERPLAAWEELGWDHLRSQ